MEKTNRTIFPFVVVIAAMLFFLSFGSPGHSAEIDRATKADIASLTRAIWSGIYNTTPSQIRTDLDVYKTADSVSSEGAKIASTAFRAALDVPCLSTENTWTLPQWFGDVGITGYLGIIGSFSVTGQATVTDDLHALSDFFLTGNASFTVPVPVTGGGSGAGDAATARTNFGVLASQTVLDHTNATTDIHGSGAGTRFLTASETILDAQIPAAIARDVEIPGVGSFSFQDLSAGTVPVASGGTGATDAATAWTTLGGGTAGKKNTGTSGDAVGLLNTANTHSADQAFQGVTVNASTTEAAGEQGRTVRRHVYVVRDSDNVATSVFSISTTDETGSYDGGNYAVFVRGVVSHSGRNSSGNSACKSFSATFCRIMTGAGAGVNSAVTEESESASAATDGGVRDVGAITMTVAEISEFRTDILFQTDVTGASPSVQYYDLIVEVVYGGFTNRPVIAETSPY